MNTNEINWDKICAKVHERKVNETINLTVSSGVYRDMMDKRFKGAFAFKNYTIGGNTNRRYFKAITEMMNDGKNTFFVKPTTDKDVDKTKIRILELPKLHNYNGTDFVCIVCEPVR